MERILGPIAADMTATAPWLSSRWFDIVSSIILTVGSLVTAWNGYEATRWGSRQSEAMGQTQAARFAATRAASIGGQAVLVDVLVFTNWLTATHQGDRPLADFYQARFRPAFRPAFEAWLQTAPLADATAPTTPFDMAGYFGEQFRKADELEEAARTSTQAAMEASHISARYIQNTLYVAVALFFAGISRTFEWRTARVAMLASAGIMLLIGIVNTVQLPMA